ncbi:large ribosomal subunit protein uL23m-like [Bolinopsis microptera]|uniref:large ribosomal subunit protein uL23m-like n=1 Tax=Bolinopsis microptera TaxID=2820187 RepID=UPI0030793663
MRVIPPRDGIPTNTVMFECSFQMNKTEIKDYLKDIYNLETQQVNTEVVDGERFKFQVPELGIKTHTNTHKKIAYVVLKDHDMSYPNDEFFKSPDSSPESSDLVVAPS